MDVNRYLDLVRANQPLVHHLTNWVTIYDCAQVVKSFGASPVMAHAAEESADMASIASALVLNIGTLTAGFIGSMKTAALSANRKGIPVVLDVCGAGATQFRDKMCFELLGDARIDIIKGNASEVARIAGSDVRTRGVDSGAVNGNLVKIAAGLASERKCAVVITGKDDIVTDGTRCLAVSNGHELMAHVVGTGCMAASVIGTFAGSAPADTVGAAAAGLCCFGIAAELAVKNAGGPGSFTNCLFDEIYRLDKDIIENMKRISTCAVTTL